MADYSWLSEYKRTWEDVKVAQDKPQEESIATHHLRPLLRRFILILDYSKASTKKDFKPSRHKLISQISESFEELFYNCNPLSRLQTIVCKAGKAYLASSKKDLTQAAEGEFSIQNSLKLSLKLLEDTGPHWSNEILIILNSISTCDPENVWDKITKLQENHVQVNVISTCAEFFTLKEFTRQTGGRWIVAENEKKLRGNFEAFAKAGRPAYSAALIPMGFSWASHSKSPCACHFQMSDGFICPVCASKVCSLPSQCPMCKYILVNAPHLTKASLSMSPLQPFALSSGPCSACEAPGSMQCPSCNSLYCSTCEEFLRSSLGKCIECSFA